MTELSEPDYIIQTVFTPPPANLPTRVKSPVAPDIALIQSEISSANYHYNSILLKVSIWSISLRLGC